MTIGSAIRTCRTRKGLKQRELADLAELTTSYVSQVERDKRDPSLSTLRQLAKALGLPLTILLFLAGENDDLGLIDKELAEKLSATLFNLMRHATDNGDQRRLI